MQFVGKILDYYNTLNPSNLTGAIDVIVVEDPETGERRCSPFHVRIGKFSLMRPQDKRVDVAVNGESLSPEICEMKVGEVGEAFFVIPEEKLAFGDEELQSTSPLPPIPKTPPSPKHQVEELSLSPVKLYDTPHNSLYNVSKSLNLSDTEVDYAICRQERWMDVLEYLGDGDRLKAQLRDVYENDKVSVFEVKYPLKVCPLSDYPMIINDLLDPLDHHKYLMDYQDIITSDDRLNSVIVKVGKWYFPGKIGAILGVGVCMFGRVLTLQQFNDLMSPKTIIKQSPVPAPSYWRFWSRSENTSTINIDTNQNSPNYQATQNLSTQASHSIGSTVDDKPRRFIKSLRLTSDQLKKLPLKAGANTVTFTFTSGKFCQSRIFLWPVDAKIVISDIDGTITKSDMLGHILYMMNKDWTHSGVAGLFDRITKNGYYILYLTARAIGQAGSTRDYLKNVEQDQFQLPDGPVIMSPDRLLAALRREVIIGNPEEFKIACLQDISCLFADNQPFYAGFGNRFTDAQSYHAVGIPTHRIFLAEPSGEVRVEHGLGYASTYLRLTDLADLFFPPINNAPEMSGSDVEDYTDFSFWKRPVLPVADVAHLLPPPASTAIVSGDKVILIDSDGHDDEDKSEYPFI